MRCRNCDYRLWNLKSRRCPECGTDFLPSEYEFVPGSVQFFCPHCKQPYYGTDRKGHLVPQAFDCVNCGNHIDMDEMVLLPTEGLREEQTKVHNMPWLERRERGLLKAWFSTIWMAMVSPIQLIKLVPMNSSAGSAWRFALLTNGPLYAIVLGLLMIFPMLAVVASMGVGSGKASVFLGIALVPIAAIIVILIGIGLWGLVTHLLLRLLDRPAGTIDRTYQAICYSSGANVVTAIPCFGVYFGWLWWLVSAILMVKEGQQVRGGRATIAVMSFPLIAMIGFFALTMLPAILFSSSITTITTQPFTTVSVKPAAQMSSVLGAVLDYAKKNNGNGPQHAIELIADRYIMPDDLVVDGSGTTAANVPVGHTTLDRFIYRSTDQERRIVRGVLKSSPDKIVAHRLGDFVFTYHGINLESADPRLWIVIMWPDPDANPSISPEEATVVVGLADKTVTEISMDSFAAQLVEQNAIRAGLNLPPIPDPATVTHSGPAK